LARRLVDAGADGLVLFNRYLHPDIDLERLELALDLELSTPAEMRLPLRWIGILRGPLSASLAATSGVHSADDVLKLLLAGADVAMMASTLLRYGPHHLATILADVRAWLEGHEYESVTQLKGSMSREHVPNREAYERANYVKTLVSYTSKLP
ncbi:MAG TPA: dihydroorotate dehydrogenase-like protein, partial [Pirellulales bacterium]|nr:dihydroorotate dehydrogenase-like protein [Pirellulales bacterium]